MVTLAIVLAIAGSAPRADAPPPCDALAPEAHCPFESATFRAGSRSYGFITRSWEECQENLVCRSDERWLVSPELGLKPLGPELSGVGCLDPDPGGWSSITGVSVKLASERRAVLQVAAARTDKVWTDGDACPSIETTDASFAVEVDLAEGFSPPQSPRYDFVQPRQACQVAADPSQEPAFPSCPPLGVIGFSPDGKLAYVEHADPLRAAAPSAKDTLVVFDLVHDRELRREPWKPGTTVTGAGIRAPAPRPPWPAWVGVLEPSSGLWVGEVAYGLEARRGRLVLTRQNLGAAWKTLAPFPGAADGAVRALWLESPLEKRVALVIDTQGGDGTCTRRIVGAHLCTGFTRVATAVPAVCAEKRAYASVLTLALAPAVEGPSWFGIALATPDGRHVRPWLPRFEELSFSAGGAQALAHGPFGDWLLDASSGRWRRVDAAVESPAWRPGTQELVSPAVVGGAIRGLDLVSPQGARRPLHRAEPDCVTWLLSPDGQKLVSYCLDAVLGVVELASGVRRDIGSVLGPPPVAWSPDGRELAFVSTSPSSLSVIRVALDDMVSRVVYEARVHQGEGRGPYFEDIGRLVWSPDGRWLAVEVVDGRRGAQGVRLLDLPAGTARTLPDAHGCSFAPDGAALACGSLAGSRVYDTASGGVLWQTPHRIVGWSPRLAPTTACRLFNDVAEPTAGICSAARP